MAHERRPPPGYIECFRPDFELVLNFPNPPEVRRTGGRDDGGLTDQEIVRCEDRFRADLSGSEKYDQTCRSPGPPFDILMEPGSRPDRERPGGRLGT